MWSSFSKMVNGRKWLWMILYLATLKADRYCQIKVNNSGFLSWKKPMPSFMVVISTFWPALLKKPCRI